MSQPTDSTISHGPSMEEQQKPPQLKASEEPPLPRLHILHLMLWTACSGAMIMLGVLAQSFWDMPEEFVRVVRLRAALSSVFSGLAVAGTITLLIQAARGRTAVFRYPGHWLLFQYALVSVGSRTVQIAVRLSWEAGMVDGSLRELALSAVMASGALVFIVGMVVTRPSLSWKSYLLIAAGCQLGMAAVIFSNSFSWALPNVSRFMPVIWFASSMSAVFLLFIGTREWMSGLQRDWLHRAGIIAVVGNVLMSWLLHLLQPLLMN